MINADVLQEAVPLFETVGFTTSGELYEKMENSGFQCSSKQEVFTSAVIVGTKKHKKCILEGYRKQVLRQK